MIRIHDLYNVISLYPEKYNPSATASGFAWCGGHTVELLVQKDSTGGIAEIFTMFFQSRTVKGFIHS